MPVSKQYNLVPVRELYGWEDDCTSGVSLAMCHRFSGIATYGLSGLEKGDEYPNYALGWQFASVFFDFIVSDVRYVMLCSYHHHCHLSCHFQYLLLLISILLYGSVQCP